MGGLNSKICWSDIMFGTLREIEITEDLIMKIAREQYAKCNEGVLGDQREDIRVGWIVGAGEILDDFNTLAKIFKKINFKCDVDNFGCDWDVEEYYKE